MPERTPTKEKGVSQKFVTLFQKETAVWHRSQSIIRDLPLAGAFRFCCKKRRGGLLRECVRP
jgi:hypothetical protein